MTLLGIIISLIAVVNLLLTWFVMFRLHQPTTIFMWLTKVLVCALSPVLFLTSIFIAVAGALLDFLPAACMSSLSAALYLIYILNASRSPEVSTGFETVFGTQWENNITSEMKSFMLPRRYGFIFPKSLEPV